MGWIKNKIIGLMLSLSKTEKMFLSDKDSDDSGIGKYQSHRQGMLSDSLIKGELTQEVKELRWRLYKVIQHSKNYKSDITGYEEDGTPIVNTTIATNKSKLNKYGCDESDNEFKLKVVVPNDNLTNDSVDITDKINDETNDISRDNYLSNLKKINTLLLKRDHLPMFKIEDYTTKMLIREMPDHKVLLEFYVSKYRGEDKKSTLFLSEIKKIIKGKKYRSPILDFNSIFFISDNCLGVIDNLEFEFEIIKFHRILEYDGDYVIKFVANKKIYGKSVFDKYKLSDLEEKYENKDKK